MLYWNTAVETDAVGGDCAEDCGAGGVSGPCCPVGTRLPAMS